MKQLIKCLVAAAMLLTGSAFAANNMKILVPANPGGGWDQTGRALGDAMQKAKTAKNVRIDNRGGAGGTIGITHFVNTFKGDPESLMVGGLVMVGAIELAKAPITLKNVTPIARLTAEYEAIVVPANSKFKTLKELLDAFKANPGSVAWGGGSAGGVDHILVGLIAKELKVDPTKINYVPYAGGGEAMAAILGGHVAAGVSGYGEFAAQIKAGKLRALAVSSPKRIGIAPDVATLKEQGVNIELYNWRGVFGAPGLSAAQRATLTKEVVDTVKSPAWQEVLKRNDWENVLMTGPEFDKFINAEVTRVGQVLKEVGLAK
jgi:putative tricarboxylic transport membrane protein